MLLRLSITLAGVLATLVFSVLVAAAQTKARPPMKQTFAAAHQPSHSSRPFRDPQGRYSLSVPAGWVLGKSADDPTFLNGASWIHIRIVTSNSPSAAVDQTANEFRTQFTIFNTVNRGNTIIAGRASHGLNIDAMTTGGQRVSVLLTAQPAGKKQYFVLVSATPVAHAPQLNTSVMALANSVRFAGE